MYKEIYMKKVIFTVFIFAFATGITANSYEVKYNSAGAVINTQQPVFGSNASFTPENRAISGERNRRIKYEQQYYNGLEKGRTINVNINDNSNVTDNDNTATTTEKDRTIRKYAKDKLKKTTTENDD